MEKIWLNSYPPGVPAEIKADQYSSLNDLFAWICHRFRDQPAFSNMDATLSWDRLDVLSHQFAVYLQRSLRLSKGDRVAIMLPNLLQYPVALFGIWRAGCVVVNVNPQYTARELEYQLTDSGASAIIVLDNFAHTLEEVLASTRVRHVITTRVGDLLPFPKAQIVNLVVKHIRHMVPPWHIKGAVRFPDALRHSAGTVLAEVPVGLADTACLQYTGGTTGVPKGAVLSHGNLVANIEQTAAWVRGVLVEGDETAIIPLPLYHVFALTVTLTLCRLGARSVLITNPRELPAFVRELKHTPFSVIIGVNTLFKALLDAPGFSEVRRAGVKLVVAGGMAVQRAVAERWHQAFGAPIIEGYGLTETSPIVCANPPDIKEFSGTIGLPLPSTDVALLDEDGAEVAAGQPGEICVRGPQVMQGYWNMPEETAQVFTADGWLRTGDIGFMTADGSIKLVDRKKDMIVVSGLKVYPNEVEDVVAMYPGVSEVVAVRAADEHSDEVVKIVVVRGDPAVSAEALVAHCRENLAAYKVPKIVVFRTEPLPKSNVGKILRRVVLEEEQHMETEDQPPPGSAIGLSGSRLHSHQPPS